MGILTPGVGDIVRNTHVNQYGDVPGVVQTGSFVGAFTLTSSTYAALATPVSCSLVTTHASTLVRVSLASQFGSSAYGVPANAGLLSVALSGSFTQAASDVMSVQGVSPGQPVGSQFAFEVVVPAGTLVASIQGKFLTSTGMRIVNPWVQLTAVRPV